jgi:hypothetical protein
MQEVVTIENKQPSEVLEKLTEECVSQFGKLNISINKTLEQGRIEGFSDIEVGDMIRRKLLSAGYSKMTVSRALPPSAKHLEKARHQFGNKMLPKPKLKLKQQQQQETLTTKTLEFESIISSKGGNRKYINIPSNLSEELKGHEGKRITVSIMVS